MEEHKATTTLWDKTDRADPPLRRPNNSLNSTSISNVPNTVNSSIGGSVPGDIVSTSKLSATAKEWFPQNYTNRNSTSTTSDVRPATRSVQNRLLKFKEESVEPQFRNNEYEWSEASDETSEDISKLHHIICTLIEDPGQYDELCGLFVEILAAYFDNAEIILNIASIIFNQGLLEPSFRYNAARLCSVIEDQCLSFRQALKVLCEKGTAERGFDSNLTLFLAELYSQLNHDPAYAQLLLTTLDQILSVAHGNNIKSSCQVLKLTGASLEAYNTNTMNVIFNRLEEVKGLQDDSVKTFINSVMALRASNWGQGQNSPPSTRFSNGEMSELHDGPIFYGPDGKELTDEERQFLTDNCSYQAESLTDDSDAEGVWDPDPEMNEEMQAAYRQFIQFNK